MVSTVLRRCGIPVLAAVTLACLSASPALAKPKGTGASVVGRGQFGDQNVVPFDFNAQAQYGSSAATGYIKFDVTWGHYEGIVTCVQVVNGIAGVSGRMAPSTTGEDITVYPGFYLYVAESTATSPDQAQFVSSTSIPAAGDCAPQFPAGAAEVTSGDIVLTPEMPKKVKPKP